jgi:sigma-B regulation protein RsbQ
MGSTDAVVVPSADRCRLHRVRVDGSVGPVLIMAHGFGTDQTVWDRVMPTLASTYQVVRLDLAGAGPNAAETFDPLRYA